MTFPIPATARWSSSASPSGIAIALAQPPHRLVQVRRRAPAGPVRACGSAPWRTSSGIGEQLHHRRVEADRHRPHRSRARRPRAGRAAARARPGGIGARSPSSACASAAIGHQRSRSAGASRAPPPHPRTHPPAPTGRARATIPVRAARQPAAPPRRPARGAAPWRFGRWCRPRAWTDATGRTDRPTYRPGRRGQSVYCGRPGRPAAGPIARA